MKKISYLFSALAIIITNMMFAVVAYNYRDMLCGIEHAGFSAPATVAFLYAIPFLIVVAVCIVLAVVFYRKAKKKREE